MYSICQECGLRFFNQRYSVDELNKLYHNYRKDAYFNERNAFEPWYTKEINFSIGNNIQEIAARKTRVQNFIQQILPGKTFCNILDYGGDRGQFIPDQLFKDKIVYDISGVVADDNILKISDLKKIENTTLDFIMLAHVAEHLPDPNTLFQELKKLSRNEHTYLYVEVPNEQFRLINIFPETIYKTYLGLILIMPVLLKIIDFISTSFKHFFHVIPPLGFVKLHEHINFFTKNSLRILIERNGFHVLQCEISEKKKYDHSVIMCLAKRSSHETRI